jgi:predicted RecB family nuclease
MTYPIMDLAGVEADAAEALKSAGIRTTARLLEAARSPRERKRLAERTGLNEKSILAWASMADRMRIKGVGQDYASLLGEVGVKTVQELKYRNPQKLAQAMAAANAKRKLVGVLPSDQAVQRWIDHARKLPHKLTY